MNSWKFHVFTDDNHKTKLPQRKTKSETTTNQIHLKSDFTNERH